MTRATDSYEIFDGVPATLRPQLPMMQMLGETRAGREIGSLTVPIRPILDHLGDVFRDTVLRLLPRHYRSPVPAALYAAFTDFANVCTAESRSRYAR